MFALNETAGNALQWTSPAVTGALAAWIFYFYRQDRKDAREKLRSLLDRYDRLAESFRGIIENNTAAVTKLTTLVERHLNEKR